MRCEVERTAERLTGWFDRVTTDRVLFVLEAEVPLTVLALRPDVDILDRVLVADVSFRCTP